ncbi:MAG TPA: hypothetical protein VK026_01515 [Paenalcaligenes sp.]|nr:hypothetical protein [Paenalcaligenes sp.]
MSERARILTNKDHNDLDAFFKRIFKLHKSEEEKTDDLVAIIGQVIGAIDMGNLGEVRSWTANPGNLDSLYSSKSN